MFEDEDDIREQFEGTESEQEFEDEEFDDEESYLEEEETIEELDVDSHGHVRPRQSRFDDDLDLD